MGYNIRIGNAEPETEWPDVEDYPLAHWVVKGMQLESAPSFPDSARSNERNPSYTGWADFADALNLREFFFDKDMGKMRRHPGCFKLTKGDVDLVRKHIEAYKIAHPDAQPTCCMCESCSPTSFMHERDDSRPSHNPHADVNLMRAEWLLFWMEWAVDNCKRPAIWNM